MEDVTVTSASVQSVADGELEPGSSDVIVCSGGLEAIDPVKIQDACDSLYAALRPGGQLLLRVAAKGAGLASPTAIVVGLLRAGFEVVAREPSAGANDLRLLRPLELADIAAFSGLRTD